MNITTYKSSDMRRALCMGGLLAILCVPLWADPDIANNVTTPYCDDSVLESDTGPVGIEINWAPNHITLNWYEDSSATTPMTVGASSQSCDYDGTLNVPAAPAARTGYTFKGWRVRQAQCSFASSVCGLNGSDLDGLTSQGYGYARLNANAGDNESTYGLTTGSGQWAVSFTNGGIVRGIASCSSTGSTAYDTAIGAFANGTMTIEQVASAVYGSCDSDAIQPSGTFNNSSSGRYCWCKVDSYTPSGGQQCNIQTSFSWIFTVERSDASNCATQCAQDCVVSVVQDILNFRRVLFGVER